MINKPLHISVVNAHWNNRGDEAALLALLQEVIKLYPLAKITILFKDDESIKQFPDIEQIIYFPSKFKSKIWDIWVSCLSRGLFGINQSLKKMVKTLKDSDLIIYAPGGSVINDRFYWRKQMEYLIPFICARFFKIPLFVAAPSIGPFDVNKKRPIRTWLLKTAQIFCVREDISKQYLKQIGIEKNIHVTIDSAFLSTINKDENEQKLNQYVELTQFLQKYPKTIGITITNFEWHVKLNKDKLLIKKIEDSFTQFIQLLKEKGYGVLFIPQLFGNQNDFLYFKKYSDSHIFLMKDDMDNYFQQYVISKLYAVTGMRYHSNIFAAKMATPFISVVYEEKMEGFMEMAGLTNYSILLANLSFEKLKEKLELIENNHDSIKKQLENENLNWKNKAQQTINLLQTLSFKR